MTTKTNGERLVAIETDIKYIKKSQDEMKSLMETHIIHCEERYASKWVETAVQWSIALVLGAVLTAGLALIIGG